MPECLKFTALFNLFWNFKKILFQVYNTKRYQVVQEYPINIGAYAGCLAELPKSKDEKPKNRQKAPKG